MQFLSIGQKRSTAVSAKLRTYGLTIDALTFLCPYLKHLKLGVNLRNTESWFRILLSSVPQGSIIGSILFNIFLNGLFLFVTEAKPTKFAHEEAIYAVPLWH